MMAGVSDMVLARNELARRLRDMGSNAAEVAFERLSLCVGEMREAITRTRMARIDALFSVLPRMVRDLGELGKLVSLDVDGGDVELDREMIETIAIPWSTSSAMRWITASKGRSSGSRRARARPGGWRSPRHQSGNQILIDIIDDGRGIDAEKLTQKAIAAGLITPEQALTMGWSRKLDLIFEPGLSTAAKVTEVSGRGVGMDVVRANIERIGGTVDIDSRPGHGLKLSLRVPLTLTIIPALTVSSAGCHFAIPRSAIDEIVRPAGTAVRIERWAEGWSPISAGCGCRWSIWRGFMDLPAASELPPFLVVLRAGGGERYALGVEAVHDHEELVVKPAAPALMASGGSMPARHCPTTAARCCCSTLPASPRGGRGGVRGGAGRRAGERFGRDRDVADPAVPRSRRGDARRAPVAGGAHRGRGDVRRDRGRRHATDRA